MEGLHALNLASHNWQRSLLRLTRMSRALALALLWSLASAAEPNTNKSAVVKVSGYGFLGNREMVRLLHNFQASGKLPPRLDRNFVEDATLVLLARANDEGYLHPQLQADFRLPDGAREHRLWTNALEVSLPLDFSTRWIRFKLKPGARFHYEDLQLTGIQAIPRHQARSYFLGPEVLFNFQDTRIFTPGGFRRSLAALQEAYVRAGYESARVVTNQVERNETNGAVTVQVAIQEGLPTRVRSVAVTNAVTNRAATNSPQSFALNKPYSQLWRQELIQKLQAEQYAKGFPDPTIAVSVLRRVTNASTIEIDLAARVTSGPQVQLGEVIFRGNELTKTSVLESRVNLKEGEPLNRVEAEASRQKLARLGVFDSVNLRYEEITPTERNVIYEFHEAKPISVSVLGGFGSYELLRGGLEIQDRNFFGLAHDVRLSGSQSFKASKGDLLYTIPEVFGENVNVFLQGSGLRREEESFTREEFSSSIGLQKRLVPIKTDFSLRYDYQFLNALDLGPAGTNRTGVAEARAAAIVVELNRDSRDNPLMPKSGLRVFARTEFATAALGGDVDYQRFTLGAYYHLDLLGGRLLHLGVTHGMSFTFGGTEVELPFNKRFFPGGENSVRGYQEGKASPLDAQGNQLGAEIFTLANVELEQILSKNWSIVTFFDAVGFAQDRHDYPWSEGLYSVGAGLRWRSLIGPVRLEYGYNLNRRVFDPVGTLHFSIGFPF